MSFGSRARSWMRTALRRSIVEQSQQSEWQFHIDARAEDLERAGLTREEAFRVARAEFGSLEARRDESREAAGLRALDELRADLRYAVRLLRVAELHGGGGALLALGNLPAGCSCGLSGTCVPPISGSTARQIVLFTIDPPRTRYVSAARSLLFTRLEAEIAGLPGVQAASLSSDPLVAGSRSTTHVIPTGRASRGDLDRAWVNDVGTMFFETMGIPIVHGRGLGPQDRAGSLRVAVINQQLARSFFPGVNPVGQTFVNGKDVYHIVGVSGDARFDRINTPMPPTFYRPFTQAPDLSSMTFEVRTPLDPGALVQSVRAAVARVDKDLPVFDVRSQLQQIDATLSQQRLSRP